MIRRILVSLAALGLLLAHTATAQEEQRQEKQIFRIAEGAPNRIVTPYDSVKLVTNVEHEAWSVGGVLYLLPMTGQHTIAGFVQNETGEWAVPVIFEVARIPPQEVVIADPRYQPVAEGEPEQATAGSGIDHVDPIVDALVEAINHGSVAGFRQMPQEAGSVVYVGPLRMELEHVQQRAGMRIERHRIVHEGVETRQVNEASFEVPGRLGVAVFPPMTEIEPGQEANVFIARSVSRE